MVRKYLQKILEEAEPANSLVDTGFISYCSIDKVVLFDNGERKFVSLEPDGELYYMKFERRQFIGGIPSIMRPFKDTFNIFKRYGFLPAYDYFKDVMKLNNAQPLNMGEDLSDILTAQCMKRVYGDNKK